MNNNEKAVQINNKSDTVMLIDYLEGKIVDEMILNSYIRDIEIISKGDLSVIIAVNSVYAKEVIDLRFKNLIKQGLRDVFNKTLDYELVLSGEGVLHKKSNVKSKNISKKFVFDKYVEADFNNEVIKMSKKVIKKPGKYSPLFIASKSGLGKTHLLHAIGNKVTENGFSAAYIEPNQFTRDVQQASKMGGSSVSDYADSYKGFDVLLFDDIQNLGDRSVTLKVLFEIINSQILNEKQIVIVSDKVAQNLSGFENKIYNKVCFRDILNNERAFDKRYGKNTKI